MSRPDGQADRKQTAKYEIENRLDEDTTLEEGDSRLGRRS
jgi:hypothetical protein